MARTIAALPLVLFAAACAGGLLGKAQDPPGTHPAREVRAVVRAAVDEYNAHDLNHFALRYAADIRMFTEGRWLNGFTAVLQYHRGLFERHPELSLEVTGLDVRESDDGNVLVRYDWRRGGTDGALDAAGIASIVYALRDGEWQAVVQHETPASAGD